MSALLEMENSKRFFHESNEYNDLDDCSETFHWLAAI